MVPNINISITDDVSWSRSQVNNAISETWASTVPEPSSWTSSGHVTVAVLMVFIISPIVICSNLLLLLSIRRFKRLRNPSNYFLLSLASADFSVGLLLPFGLYFEFSRSKVECIVLCLLPYCVLVLMCSVSMLSTTAIALDRYTSLASPLRYNNIITHRGVIRYITFFWIYSLLISSSPIIVWFTTNTHPTDEYCSFRLVLYESRILLFSALFAPCAITMTFCYAYVYVIARSHARAICFAEITFRQSVDNTATAEPKYGRTLAATVGLFLITWVPFQVCMLLDVLSDKLTFYLGLLALANTATNPWLYGYRNSDFKFAFLRILEDLLPKLSGTLHKYHPRMPNSQFTSCASHVRICVTPNQMTYTQDIMCVNYLHPTENGEINRCVSPFLSPSSAVSGAIVVAQV